MPDLLRQFQTLAEPVTSPSGAWALCYGADGRAVIRDRAGRTTWAAGAAGSLRLELEGVFAVYDGDQVVWRGELPKVDYTSLHVTDDGDGLLYDSGLPRHSLRHGSIEAVSLGDRAPVAEIRGNRFLRSDNGKRTVNRTPGGDGLVYKRRLGPGAASVVVVQPAEVELLDVPDTWLTWRFLDQDGQGNWTLVLVDRDDEVRWMFGRGCVPALEPEPAAEPVATGAQEAGIEDGAYSSAWMDAGLRMNGVYCVTVIRDVDPDEALRRFGAEDDQISTATWPELLRRASYEEHDVHDHVVAAFAVGSHTLLVEDNGWEAANRPDLSRGTFAVSSYCSINADQVFLVSRDGEILAEFDDNYASSAEGAEPFVVAEALAEMGIDDPEAFDADDENLLDDLELLCRVAGIRPRIADITGPAQVAILPRRFPWPAGRAD